MNQECPYRALVVEDELAMRKLLILALRQRGFKCDAAADGIAAESLAAAGQYQLVVTDLKMPNKHGHALATHLLTLSPRPVIVVHTGVIEPRLAKDLLERGVDDILFKPFDLGVLAAKAKVLVERRFSPAARKVGAPAADNQGAGIIDQRLVETRVPETSVPLSHLEDKLSGLSRVLPISKAAFDVYSMTTADNWQTQHIVAAIQRDATLAAEVIRLANSSFYNPTRQPVVQLDRAVTHIGQRRVGELALATSALTTLTSGLLPWMDIALTWKRSMAAGVAVEMLIEQGAHQAIDAGLFLSAIMHPLGRVILATLYPKHYETMVERCREGDCLLDHERRLFPMTPAEAIAYLLASWNIPADIHAPLQHVHGDKSLAGMPEVPRRKAELLRLAVFVGYLAVGKWEPWDVVDPPPVRLLERLQIGAVEKVIDAAKVDLERLVAFQARKSAAATSPAEPEPTRALAYCDLSQDPFDTLGRLLLSMGIKPTAYSVDGVSDLNQGVLFNCVGVDPDRFAVCVKPEMKAQRLIVTDSTRLEAYRDFGRVVALPNSYARLRSACWGASSAAPTTKPVLGNFVSQFA